MVMFKDNVRIKVLTKALLDMLDTLFLIDSKKYDWKPDDIIVTSVNDGKHSINSRHYKNEAVDIRTKNFKLESDKLRMVVELERYLGEKFTVLYEDPGMDNQHIHVQVKKGTVYQ